MTERRSGDHRLLKSVEQYYADAERDGTDFPNPPKPPNPEVAWDVAVACSKSIALLMDFQKTSKLPDDGMEPSDESLACGSQN